MWAARQAHAPGLLPPAPPPPLERAAAWPPPFRAPQVACLAAYITALFLWAWAELLNWRLKRSKCVAGAGAAF